MLEVNESPSKEDINFLTEKISKEHPDKGEISSFSFFLRDSSGTIIAGCNGSIVIGSIYTDQLWVDPSFRNQGLGRKLMDAVHKYGEKKGCSMATVSTMSFQVPEFYKNLGYTIDFIRKGYSGNSSCISLSKKL